VGIEHEVERIRKQYDHFDHDAATRTLWSPFSEAEVAHRNQQYCAFAELFRATGRLSLADLKILDVGCGRGRMVRACLDLGAAPENVTGVDLQMNRIEDARRMSPHLDFRVGNGTDLDFPNEEFDLVMQFVVFSSIFAEDLRKRLAAEMLRILKPGAYIFWWDCVRTIGGENRQALVPQELFPGIPVTQLSYGLRPRPSYGFRPGRVSRLFSRLADRFAYPTSHYAALLGPKAAFPGAG
jgi:SAM-dependent methyltransferase